MTAYKKRFQISMNRCDFILPGFVLLPGNVILNFLFLKKNTSKWTIYIWHSFIFEIGSRNLLNEPLFIIVTLHCAIAPIMVVIFCLSVNKGSEPGLWHKRPIVKVKSIIKVYKRHKSVLGRSWDHTESRGHLKYFTLILPDEFQTSANIEVIYTSNWHKSWFLVMPTSISSKPTTFNRSACVRHAVLSKLDEPNRWKTASTEYHRASSIALVQTTWDIFHTHRGLWQKRHHKIWLHNWVS